MRKRVLSLILVLSLLFSVTGCSFDDFWWNKKAPPEIPAYSGQPFVMLDENVPSFTEEEKNAEPYEYYSELDALNRCGYAMACIDPSLMPEEERGSIGQVKPSGWQTVKYDIVDGKYLYNRCHLIGYQLTGENSNSSNLITGTRYLNMEGMLPIENMVAEYIKSTGNRVLYRVTPDFQDQELLARGVLMEGWSLEDEGLGICFKVYAYNVQPGIVLDYQTGDSYQDGDLPPAPTEPSFLYLVNIYSKKFHKTDCKQGRRTRVVNKRLMYGTREMLILLGYKPAQCCDP